MVWCIIGRKINICCAPHTRLRISWNFATVSSRLRDPLAQPFKKRLEKGGKLSIARQNRMEMVLCFSKLVMYDILFVQVEITVTKSAPNLYRMRCWIIMMKLLKYMICHMKYFSVHWNTILMYCTVNSQILQILN